MKRSSRIRERVQRRQDERVNARVFTELLEEFKAEMWELEARHKLTTEAALQKIKDELALAIEDDDPVAAAYCALAWWDAAGDARPANPPEARRER